MNTTQNSNEAMFLCGTPIANSQVLNKNRDSKNNQGSFTDFACVANVKKATNKNQVPDLHFF